MKRISAALALTAALSFGVAAYAQTATTAAPVAPVAATFSDVPAGHYAQEAIQKITAAGLILGFPDGTYRGNENLTRYQAAVILSRLIDLVAQGKIGTSTAPSTTGQNMDQDTLTAVQNAVQELAADLAQMGVRVANLEDNAVTKDDLARVETIAQNAADKVDALAAGTTAADMSNFVTQDQIQSLATLDDIAALQDAISNAATQDDLLALTDKIDALGTGTATVTMGNPMADDLAALQDAIAGLQDQVANAATVDDLTAIQDAVTALQDQVANMPTADDISTIQDSVATLQDTVSSLQDQAGTAVTADDIAAIQESITSLQDQVAALPSADDVSALQDTVAQLQDAAANYVTVDDLASLSVITDLTQMAQDAKDLAEATATDLGQAQDAIQTISDQLDATSTAADTALSQARELSDRFDELTVRVDDVTGQLTDLSGTLNEVSSTVQNQGDSISSLNDLVVLLNQDTLALQDRATEIEKVAADQQAIIDEIPNIYATQDDMEALREYTTLLRRDVNALSDRTDGLDARVATAEGNITNLQGRVTVLENTAATISGSLSLNYTHSATWFSSGAGIAPDFDIDRVIDGSSLSTGVNGADADAGLLPTPRDYTDISGQSPVNPRLPGGSANGFTTAGNVGPVNGAFGVSFSLNLGFTNRNAVGAFGLMAPITLSGSLGNGAAITSGTAYALYLTPTFGNNFTVAAGQAVSINFGQGIKFKFANYAFNNIATGRGDGIVVNVNGAGILPFSPTLTGVYGSRSVLLAPAVAAVTTTATLVTFPAPANFATNGNAYVVVPVPTTLGGTTVTSITGTYNTAGPVATPFTVNVPAGATSISLPIPAPLIGLATTVTLTTYDTSTVVPAVAAVNGQAYFTGVKGTLSIIPGIVGGVYYAREGGDVFTPAIPLVNVYGANVNGSLFGFLNLDGEYTLSSNATTSASAMYLKANTTLGIFTVGGNFRNIAPNYDAVARAGLSLDTAVDANRPYAPDQVGFGANVGIALPAILGLGITATFDSAHEIDGTGAAFKLSGATTGIVTEMAYGVNVSLHLIGFDVTPSFSSYNESALAGQSYATPTMPAAVVPALAYSKTAFGVGIRHGGIAPDSIIAGLNIGASYNMANYGGNIYVGTWTKTVMSADAAYTLNLGPLHLSPFVGYSSTSSNSVNSITPAYAASGVDTVTENTVDLRYGAALKTDPIIFGASIGLFASQDNTAHNTIPTNVNMYNANTFRAGASLNFASFILPNSTFSVAYGFRKDINRAGLGVYDGTDGNGTMHDGTGFGGDISGLTFAASYYGLNFAYGVFGVHNYATGSALEWGSKFTIGYTFKF